LDEPARRTDASGADLAELDRLRGEIDRVDREILARLNERAEWVHRVGELKRAGGSGPVYVASRERDLVAALQRANRELHGRFPTKALPHVFREIISATRSLEERHRVAFLGPEGTFSHEAAARQFGGQVELVPVPNFREVYARVERGDAHFGVVPVENTTTGAVTESMDILVESEVMICGELLVPVAQNLLSQSGDIARIRRVASHPQPLAQCRSWLQRHLPDATLVDVGSTAAAAQRASEDAEVAAIGSEIAARVYDLRIVERAIEDVRGNTTRFLVVGRESPGPSGDDLTSAVFTLQKDKSGALHTLLEPFARHHVNLTSIQSRPMKGKPWEYLFFVDMCGHASDPDVAAALSEAATSAHSAKILGSFPRAATADRELGRVAR